MMRIATLLLSAGLSLGASATLAQERFTPPEGCTGVLTIQHRACVVMNVWTCAADDPGIQWLGLFVPQGLFTVTKVDAEFQWLETRRASPQSVEVLDEPSADPSSITDLLAEGVDTYDFTTQEIVAGTTKRIVGYDMIAGEEIEIDGEPLLPIEFSYENRGPDGEVLERGVGAQYLSVRHRLFFIGRSWETETPEDVRDMSPVEFLYPDDPGFLSTTPKYDCGLTDAGFRP